MAFCRKCGSELAEGQLFCTRCGEPVETMNNNTATQTAEAPQSVSEEKGKLNMGMLIWSIVNLVCGAGILGIIALVFTIMADNQPLEKSNGYLKIAKILNIVGTVMAAVAIFFIIIYVIFAIILGIGLAAGL